ncbi:MAG: DUF3221 domain-containing protein [Clostridia bacterium]|nr:DUF3221 domain-containing protein [Clostridia bacterium]
MNKTIKTVLIVLLAIAVVIGIASGIRTYSVNADIGGKIFAPSKYYEQYIIGTDRADKEQTDLRYYISEDLLMSQYNDDGVNYTVSHQCQLEETDDNELVKLITEVLPGYYSQLSVAKMYTGTSVFDLTESKTLWAFVRFSNGATIFAYLPCNGDGNYYIHEACKLKTVERNATADSLPSNLAISGTTSYTQFGNVSIRVIEADYSSDTPYITALISNSAEKTMNYGSEYRVYRIEDGKRIECVPLIDNLTFNSELYTVNGNSSVTRKFNLQHFDLSKPATYSIEFYFEFEGGTSEYKAVIDFEITDTPENYSLEQNTSELPDEFTTNSIQTYSFNATVLVINENNILVEPIKDESELNSADRIYVNTTELTDLPELAAGDKITVTYDGQIQETYPAQITTVYSVKITE